MFNTQQIKGKYQQVQGKVLMILGKLLLKEDYITQGKRKELIGKIWERAGLLKKIARLQPYQY